MTCMCCGGVSEPNTLKMVSNEMLLAEINERKRQVQKQRDEFYKIHWAWEKFGYIWMTALCGFCFLGLLAGAFGLQIMREPIMLRSMGIIAIAASALIILIIFKNTRVRAQFRKEYFKEAKLFSDI